MADPRFLGEMKRKGEAGNGEATPRPLRRRPQQGGVPPVTTAEALQQRLEPPSKPAWGDVEAALDRRQAPAQVRQKAKRIYWEEYGDPEQSWEQFQEATEPGALERFEGGYRGMLGGVQSTLGYAAGELGFEDASETLQDWSEANRRRAAETATVLPKKQGWAQLEHALNPDFWEQMLYEALPQAAPSIAATASGAYAGSKAGAVGGPYGALAGSILGGIIGIGGTTVLQTLGPAYEEYLAQNPGDEEGATEYAWKQAGLQSLWEAASVPLGALGYSLGPLKHSVTQLAVQSLHGAGSGAVQNAVAQELDPDQRLDENLLQEAVAEGMLEAPGIILGLRSARTTGARRAGLSGGETPAPEGTPRGAVAAEEVFGRETNAMPGETTGEPYTPRPFAAMRPVTSPGVPTTTQAPGAAVEEEVPPSTAATPVPEAAPLPEPAEGAAATRQQPRGRAATPAAGAEPALEDQAAPAPGTPSVPDDLAPLYRIVHRETGEEIGSTLDERDARDLAEEHGNAEVLTEPVGTPAMPDVEDGAFHIVDRETGEELGSTLQREDAEAIAEEHGNAEVLMPGPEARQRLEIDRRAHEAATSPLSETAEPTQAQKEAGNYRKGRVSVLGIPVSVENPAGSTRTWTDAQGRQGETMLQDHYGYIRGTDGRDGEQIDTFVGPAVASPKVYVVDQVNPETGRFDEHKVVLGARSENEARDIYQRNFEPDWKGLGGITEMTLPNFKRWLSEGNTNRRLTRRNAPRQPARLVEDEDLALARFADDLDALQQDIQAATGRTQPIPERAEVPGYKPPTGREPFDARNELGQRAPDGQPWQDETIRTVEGVLEAAATEEGAERLKAHYADVIEEADRGTLTETAEQRGAPQPEAAPVRRRPEPQSPEARPAPRGRPPDVERTAAAEPGAVAEEPERIAPRPPSREEIERAVNQYRQRGGAIERQPRQRAEREEPTARPRKQAAESRRRPRSRQRERPELINAASLRQKAVRMLGADAPELRIIENLVSTETGQAIAGRLSKAAIEVSAWAENPSSTLNHEIMHAARQRVLTREDNRALDSAFDSPNSPASRMIIRHLRDDMNEPYAADHAAVSKEERIAYAFEHWMRGHEGASATSSVRRVFRRLVEALRRLWRVFRNENYGNAEQVFRALAEGRRATTTLSGPTFIGEFESRLLGTPRPENNPRKFVDKVLSIPFRLTGWSPAMNAMERMAAPWVPERLKAMVVDRYGLDEGARMAHENLNRAFLTHVAQIHGFVDDLSRVIGDRRTSAIIFEWMQEKPDTAREQDLLEQIPAEGRQIVQKIKRHIRDLGVEAVRLNQLSEEAFRRNEYAYLHRIYRKHELGEDGKPALKRQASRKVIGDTYKGRGIFEQRDFSRLMADAGEEGKALLARGAQETKGTRFYRLDKRDAKGRLWRTVWLPADAPLPAQYTAQNGWRLDATEDGIPNLWEHRFATKGGKVTLWRDFTRDERTRMGEIDEVRYVVARTLLNMTHDIEVGRYFEWIAAEKDDQGRGKYVRDNEEDLPENAVVKEASKNLLRTFKPNEWVWVPDTPVPHTRGQVKKYGALAGKLVQGPVWNDVRQTVNFNWLPQWWSKPLKWFKLSKTAYSPTVHINNVMANVWLAEWADLQPTHFLKALKVQVDALRGDAAAKEEVQRLQQSGALIGTYVTSEIRQDVLGPLEAELRQELSANVVEDPGGFARAYFLFDAITHKIKNAAGKPIDLYQFEDNIFRHAIWRQKVAEGMGEGEAGAAAKDAFLNYEINAPWVNAARQTGLPFIAFTYRIVPKLYDLLKNKPWKILKIAMVMHALNGLGYALSGGDEDEERALMPDRLSGDIWGLFPRQIRMPWNAGRANSPIFGDILRWVPGGDIFELNDQTALPIIPKGIVPGGPVELFTELMTNRNAFTGEPLIRETDTPVEQAEKVTMHLYRHFAPNFFLLPRSYAWDKLGMPGSERAELDPFGREYSTLLEAAQAFGIKLSAFPKDEMQYREMQRVNRLLRDLKYEQSKVVRMHARNAIGRGEMERRIKRLEAKQRRLIEEHKRKMTRARGG